jgi:hypothetical protein
MAAPALFVFIQGQSVASADNLNTFIQSCDTLSQLRGFVGSTPMTVQSRGQNAVNDGGGGWFYWLASSSAPDDNNNTIVPPGLVTGAWIRLSLR